MKRLIVAVFVVLAVRVHAADARTPDFLRAYVKALCAEKAGDHDAAVAAMQPFVASWGDMKIAANTMVARQYADAANHAAAALLEFRSEQRKAGRFQVLWNDVKRGWTISGRDRKTAITDLQICFGPAVLEGAKAGPTDLEAVAAAFVEFLMRDPNGRDARVDMRFHLATSGGTY